jgi:hypothetical protein
MITMMHQKFSQVYTATRNLSFDEACCPWRGRLKWKVYNPAKPNKFHMKLYTVCEAESGYVIGFDVYTGSTECVVYGEGVDVDPDFTQTTKIVVGLLAYCGLLNKGYHVYMDNYYNSPELLDFLDSLDTYACGTLRTNRKQVPKALKGTKLRKGEAVFRRRGNLLALKWHDKRDVSMLSTIHEAKRVVPEIDDNIDEMAEMKPTCIADYCKFMGGVDVADHMLQYYSVFRKTNKYWRKLFFHLLNMIITNAWLLYKKYGHNRAEMSHS